MGTRSKKPTNGPESDEPSAKTKTLPEEQRGPWLEGPDVVTMLGVYGSAIAFELPRTKISFVLGRDKDADIFLDTKHMSRTHCVLTRRGPLLHVTDMSTNGTIFNGRVEKEFDIRPGETFLTEHIRLLAMNDEMRVAHPALVELLGTEEEHVLYPSESPWPRPSDVLVAATGNSNMIITGEDGCDHARLVHVIHQVSLVRRRPIVEVSSIPEDRSKQREIIDAASRSMLVIAVPKDPELMDPAFESMIFSPAFHIRVVALAKSRENASRMLGTSYVNQMQHVQLLPLARRPAMIPRLLDQLLKERGAGLQFGRLTPRNQEALREFAWPENFNDLRDAANLVAAMETGSTVRAAAKALGVPTTTFYYWMQRFGLTRPLTL